MIRSPLLTIAAALLWCADAANSTFFPLAHRRSGLCFKHAVDYSPPPDSHSSETLRSHVPKTSKDFFVDGKKLPGVSEFVGDIGPSFAGLLPTHEDPSKKQKYFFWYWPPSGNEGHDTVTIWLNGGPGCSSLVGALQENGPFLVSGDKQNRTHVRRNPYSWHHTSHVVYIEQPESTGFSKTGPVDVKDEPDIAARFEGFLKNFFATFSHLRGKRLFITGESYAGVYIPYIVDHLVRTTANPYNVQGWGVVDGYVNHMSWLRDVPLQDFLHKHNNYLKLTPGLLHSFSDVFDKTQLSGYLAKHLRFPPLPSTQVTLPAAYHSYVNNKLLIWDHVAITLQQINPCLDLYYLPEPCGVYDPLVGTDAHMDEDNWLNRPAFRAAIHVDEVKAKWTECSFDVPFKHQKDASKPPMVSGVWQRAVEKVKRVHVLYGDFDMILISDGALISLQNQTWRGAQGFQKPPSSPIIGANGQKRGVWHSERGLTWLRYFYAGHMLPAHEPALLLKQLRVLLGHLQESALSHRD